MRLVPLNGSHVVQWHPLHLPYLLQAFTHFFAGVGASAPAMTMQWGCTGVFSSRGIIFVDVSLFVQAAAAPGRPPEESVKTIVNQ
jgi:hypothetical protein